MNLVDLLRKELDKPRNPLFYGGDYLDGYDEALQWVIDILEGHEEGERGRVDLLDKGLEIS